MFNIFFSAARCDGEKNNNNVYLRLRQHDQVWYINYALHRFADGMAVTTVGFMFSECCMLNERDAVIVRNLFYVNEPKTCRSELIQTMSINF